MRRGLLTHSFIDSPGGVEHPLEDEEVEEWELSDLDGKLPEEPSRMGSRHVAAPNTVGSCGPGFGT